MFNKLLMLFTKFVFGVCHTIQVLYQSYWYHNTWQISKVTGTRFWYQ